MVAPFVRRRTLLLLSLASIVVVNRVRGAGQRLQPAGAPRAGRWSPWLVAGGVLANLWLWRIAKEAHEGQEARARLAVSEERLRFARDLNDLLGQSLDRHRGPDGGRRTGAARRP